MTSLFPVGRGTEGCAPAITIGLIVAGAFFLMLFRNMGLNPVVFADEWTYSLFSRLLEPSSSARPSYLYLWLFRGTNACGEGFLECARALNALLMALAAPVIYLVARRLLSWPNGTEISPTT